MPTEEILKQAPEVIYLIKDTHDIDWSLVVNIVLVVLVVVGWLISYRLNLRQQRENLKDGLKVKVYEAFWKSRGSIQNSFSSLSVIINFGPPFVLMKSIRVPGLEYDEWKEKEKAIKYYNDFLEKFWKSREVFMEEFMNFWRDLEMWMHIMPRLEKAKKVLTEEYQNNSNRIYKHYSYLSALNKYDYEKWSQEDILKKGNEVHEDFFNFSCYVEDMMVLIHNELISPLFGYKKSARCPLDKKFKILTINGISEVEDDEAVNN